MGSHCANHSSCSPLNESCSIFHGRSHWGTSTCTACLPTAIPLWWSPPPVKSHPASQDQLKRHRPPGPWLSPLTQYQCMPEPPLPPLQPPGLPAFLPHTAPTVPSAPHALPGAITCLVPYHHSGLSFDSISSERPHPVPVTSSHPLQPLSLHLLLSLFDIAHHLSLVVACLLLFCI